MANGFKRIIIHWTAGGKVPNDTDKRHYHYMIDHTGKPYEGIFKPEANLHCVDDKNGSHYAAHTGGGNTGSIGVSMCGMMNFKDKNNVGPCPITRIQFEACMKLCAVLAQKYGIPVLSTNIMTHYEFGLAHPNTASNGKIDIIYLPPFPWLEKEDIGRFIRSKIKWYLAN